MLPTRLQNIRTQIRHGEWTGTTGSLAPGYEQANIVILPENLADDFEEYCHRNPRPCPLLARGSVGDPFLPCLGDDLDIRSDVPRYRIFLHKKITIETTDISKYWQKDFVTFVLGCSLSFEAALMNENIPLRHYGNHTTCAAYVTSIPTEPVGPFKGALVVSMRGIKEKYIEKTVEITERYPLSHGGPIHIGAPEEIGISNLNDHIDGIGINYWEQDEIPMFWACGVTSQIALKNANPDIYIIHAPGHMLITDRQAYKNENS
jgi:uncharacterized protein YcsI (UPF0317 family)